MFRKSVTLLAFSIVAASQAGVTLITNRAAIPATDMIHWGQYGPSGSSVASPSYGLTDNGKNFLVADGNDTAMTEYATSNTAGSAPYWGFGGGHDAIATSENLGPLGIRFDASQTAAGADIMVNQFGTWTVEMAAYDNLGFFLGSATTTVVSDLNIVGNAPFLGLMSDANNIGTIVYRVKTDGVAGGFAIDEVSMQNCAVPEPTSVAVLGLGMIGLIAKRRNKR